MLLRVMAFMSRVTERFQDGQRWARTRRSMLKASLGRAPAHKFVDHLAHLTSTRCTWNTELPNIPTNRAAHGRLPLPANAGILGGNQYLTPHRNIAETKSSRSSGNAAAVD